MNKFKCIVFDLDGTLIDTNPLLFNAYKSFLKKYDYVGTKKEFELLNGPKLDQIITYLKKKYTLKPSRFKLKKHYDDQIKKIYQTKIGLNDGVVHLLNFLKLNGYVIGLATSNSKKNTTSVLIKNNLVDYFSFFVYGDDVVIAKPNPEIYQICIKRSGFQKNEIFVIEDSKNGFDSAKNAGLVCKKTIKFKLLENWLSKNNISPKYEIMESKSCFVTVKPSKNIISPNMQKRINQTWNKLQKDRTIKLSNDKVLILNSITLKKGIIYISSQFIDYKNVISNRINPKINLNLIQIGISGIILLKNNNSIYTIFSRRNKNTTEYPNYYELIPSGNINQKPMKNKKLEFNFDLINEFIEETGLNSKYIKKISFLCIIKDKQNFVFDICNIIELNINKKNILKYFKSFEYSKPLFVPISLLPKFIEKNHKKIVPTSIGILDYYLKKNKLFN
jgi:HAD superfamily hydrolase (TIGR01509 family)